MKRPFPLVAALNDDVGVVKILGKWLADNVHMYWDLAAADLKIVNRHERTECRRASSFITKPRKTAGVAAVETIGGAVLEKERRRHEVAGERAAPADRVCARLLRRYVDDGVVIERKLERREVARAGERGGALVVDEIQQFS